MDVRLGYRRDAEPLSLGQLHVLIDVAQGVDDEGLPGALATDEVGILGQLGVECLSEQHGIPVFVS